MDERVSLLVIQPYLTKYRIPVFDKLCSYFDVDVLSSLSDDYGLVDNTPFNSFRVRELSIKGALYWQSGLLKKILLGNYDALLVSANPRYLSTWFAITIARLKGIKIFLHGQGSYNKNSVSVFDRAIYLVYAILCDNYIAYTEFSKESLSYSRIYSKVKVAENSVENNFPVNEKFGNENGILFIGRLRDGSNIQLLIDVVSSINSNRSDERKLQLNIIGGGSGFNDLKMDNVDRSCIIFHGEIYSGREIKKISKQCFAGCYAGDAGLSILHYMSLSLPPIVHGSLSMHMGPEPSYITHGINGVFFERNDFESLKACILKLESDREFLRSMQKNAYKKYVEVTVPSLADRIAGILFENLK